MKYEIRQPARSGDIVPLVAVADAKARFQATAGGTDFHRPAYDGTFNPFADDLLREAKAGKLKVCNCLGIPGEAEALVAEAERTGDLPVFYRYLIEPDWERLRREVEPVAPGVRNLSHLDLGPSEVDWTRTHLGALFTTLKWLNEWGSDRGDQFTVTHEGVEWFDERGIQRPRGTGAASEPAPTEEAPEARDQGGRPAHEQREGRARELEEGCEACSQRPHKGKQHLQSIGRAIAIAGLPEDSRNSTRTQLWS